MEKAWFKIKSAAKRQDLGERKIRELLKEGLRYSRLKSGTILIKAEWLDEFFESFEHKETRVDDLVDGIMGEMND